MAQTHTQRPNISGDAAVIVRRMIVDGILTPGQRINEVHLAAELGVSRTPLREALMALAAEGAIDVVPRRGFFVRPLSCQELREIYPIRAILDREALRLAGIPSTQALQELARINDEMRNTEKVDTRVDLDDAWHLGLVAHCPNEIMLDLIKQFISRTRRYELAYLKQMPHTGTAYTQHRRILRELRAGDLDAGCEALRLNLTAGQEPILKWLGQHID